MQIKQGSYEGNGSDNRNITGIGFQPDFVMISRADTDGTTKSENGFGFPYYHSEEDIQKTKNYIKDKFWNKKHSKQIHEVKWLIDKFRPVPGW